ncbi:hypothetical protein ABZW10_28330 [Kitasatospora sp. NPDC004723]|uniref:hypothetical protein n=1 Tax=Kitasatospora sp. NPDC004723 TaxID=3154288 RepID=UPI0033A0A0BF
MEHFGVDLLDLWRGRLSIRRVHVLITSLMCKPGRSVLLAAMDETAQWGTAEHLLARVSDALELSNYLFIRANSEESSDLPLPEPIPRPGLGPVDLAAPEPDFASGAEVANFFTHMSTL